ncbi:BhlA/UviB family holin-like peptide [Tepidimicrobium xylanilyticum]|uniref:BhlA holin family protein n=1 Tax=Tepidimicrobium xylanilyticum TaxID=1123352 RepID=A0A1H3F8Z3_9FIRM|nr:BhlA/UviB family holin-like peptide [Tepidimicrobium xylanilyticum]SDX05979.1 BhlA holin family protein [Tepidimicrobium xylanilyticum]SDX87441.1 BhlA holin family protein [Tepidimicrobium xylanilyticum]
MEKTLMDLATSNGIWAALYVFLFIYVLYDSKNREKKYIEREEKYQETIYENQTIIKELSKKFGVVETIQKDVSYIKDELKRR